MPHPADPSANQSIRQSLSQCRGKPTDADRAKLAIELAGQIRALPVGAEKLSLAQGLCNLSTEGDLGKEALTAAATALAQAIRENSDHSADSRAWIELASLARYEHVPAPFSDP